MATHESVLLKESIAGLAIQPDGIYIDGTFGRGGHSQAILNALGHNGKLIAIDKDAEAYEYAKDQFKQDQRFVMVQGSFADIAHIAEIQEVYGKVNGILLDLGVSSPQLDDPGRGFSFMQAGPLDMRMDKRQTMDAARFVNQAQQKELEIVFREYGEERFAGRIARAIVREREKAPILTTQILANIVKEANPKWEKHKHPATRVFQAIRIHVNQELQDLAEFLKQSLKVLTIQGRLVIISFHSLEDRIVKQFMKNEEEGLQLPFGVPVRASEIKTCFKRVGKAVKPGDEEIKRNVRSRSAVLRIGEKTA